MGYVSQSRLSYHNLGEPEVNWCELSHPTDC
jgi:hypothetical protein